MLKKTDRCEKCHCKAERYVLIMDKNGKFRIGKLCNDCYYKFALIRYSTGVYWK